MRNYLITLVLALTASGCASDGAAVGEKCETPSNTDQCVDGAVCTNDSGGVFCRLLCNDKSKCGANENCNGISGSSLKSCQPK